TQGITLEDAAARLRLMLRQVRAMETDEFESLDPPVFARGFVRNYARLLGLAPEALLARMQGAPAPTAVSHAAPPQPNSWLSSPWLILSLLGVLVVVVVPVALYWWLNSEEVDDPSASATRAYSAPAAVPAPVAEPAAVAAPAVQVDPVSPPAPAAGAAETGTAAAPEAPTLNGTLHLEFSDESWVEIRDASGRMVHRQLNQPGTSVDIPGQPPFDVVIGNATQARVTYNGRPIDLKPFIDATVARFTLEE
ncbi:MAG TPA: helix-turn-helix domain-containing protein, partial [Thiobacillus sp.]|nr:helix-turn-helix domain-containing protein [Thiobacillus sp.]